MADSLDDRVAISDLLVRYATGIDTKDWPLFRSCFTENVLADYGDIGVWNGVEEITSFMEVAHRHMPHTKHRMSNFVVEVDGATATAVSYVHAVLVFETGPNDWSDAIGHYEDKLVRTPEGWRIAERKWYPTRLLRNGNFPTADQL